MIQLETPRSISKGESYVKDRTGKGVGGNPN